MSFVFPVTRRQSYAETLRIFRRGLLSHGFMWALADRDEVFAAFLRKHDVGRP